MLFLSKAREIYTSLANPGTMRDLPGYQLLRHLTILQITRRKFEPVFPIKITLLMSFGEIYVHLQSLSCRKNPFLG